MQGWFCVTISTGVRQNIRRATLPWWSLHAAAPEPHCFGANMQIPEWRGIISAPHNGAQAAYDPVNKDYGKSARQPPMEGIKMSFLFSVID